ncbi:MAG TPA: hypothetical protein VF735_04900 [Pyrinomonadaceae bacterium]|jgi:hypothetical protein
MKLLLSYFALSVMCFGVAPSDVSSQAKDSSLLKPTDAAYQDAAEFARFLNKHGIAVKSVHRSKLESFFRGIEKAAFFRTDKGIVEVIFFPDSIGAEKVRVIEQRRDGRYFYSFEGQPNPNPPGDTIDASRPMHFLMHRNWFIMPDGREFNDALKDALKKG